MVLGKLRALPERRAEGRRAARASCSGGSVSARGDDEASDLDVHLRAREVHERARPRSRPLRGRTARTSGLKDDLRGLARDTDADVEQLTGEILDVLDTVALQ